MAGGSPKLFDSRSGSADPLITPRARSVADEAVMPAELPMSVGATLAGSELYSAVFADVDASEIKPARIAGREHCLREPEHLYC